MKRNMGPIMAGVFLASLLFSQTAFSQDFEAVLEAMDRIEANLKQLVQKEAAIRKGEIAKLRKSVTKLETVTGDGQTGVTEGQWADIMSELAALKAEMAQLQNQSQPRPQLAEEEMMDIMSELAALKAELAQVQNELRPRPQLASIGDNSDVYHSPEIDHSAGETSVSSLDARSTLEEKGVTFELVYTGELSSNVSGGLAQRSEYLENGDVLLSIDADKLLGWTGASFSFYGLGNGGGSPSGNVGDMQAVSNIEGDNTWKLYEAWYQQELVGGKLSFLTGLYDLNSEFDVTENAGMFLNSSFGIGPDFSQSGENGPSIFPVTSLAFRTRVQISNAFYVQNAILDGVPGDPEQPSGTHVKFGKTDGVLIATEVGFVIGTSEDSDAPYAKIALGRWDYTAKYDDILDVDSQGDPVRRSGNSGLYLLGERLMYREQDPSQGLAIFARLGFADTKVNQIGSYFGGGLVYSGLFPGRDEDQIGLAVAAAFNGSKYRQAQRDAGYGVDAGEVTLELSYSSQILPQFSIHPDLQYVINPSGDPDIKNGLVFTTRFELGF